jgi:hypothetical protein
MSPKRWWGSVVVVLVAFLLLVIIHDGRNLRNEIRHRLSVEDPDESYMENDLAWETELRQRLERIKEICGVLCSIDNLDSFNKYAVTRNEDSFKTIALPEEVNCDAIINSEEIDASDQSIPFPRPSFLEKEYTMNGLAREIFSARFNNSYLGGTANEPVWSKPFIEKALDDIKEQGLSTLKGTYGTACTSYVFSKIEEMGVKDLDVLVIGSEKPWVEIICLYLGAKSVTTLEYGEINTDHPKMKTMTPDDLRRLYKAGEMPLFDIIVSHSSIEHSGLGRYGDALNPWGDILTVMRAWCLSKPDARMYLALPTGEDLVEHNLHRVYGKYRWPLVSANWLEIMMEKNAEEKNWECGGQGFIFQKINKGTSSTEES